VNITDETPVIYEIGTVWAYDFAASDGEARLVAARLHGETGKIYNVLPFATFVEMANAQVLALFPLCEVTEEFHDTQLNILPPMHRNGALGFFICEMVMNTITTQFVHRGARFYAAYVDLLNRATWITPEAIAALPDSKPLDWFPATES